MRLDPDARRFLEESSGAVPMEMQTVEQNRKRLRNAVPLTGSAAPVEEVRELRIGGVGCRVYLPDPIVAQTAAVIYLHGGGWVTGDLDISDTTARSIASHSGVAVISVDYRRPPETPFPGALEDALAVTTAVLSGHSELRIDVNRVAVAGDSAGGNLAAVIAQQLRGNVPGLKHQALIYPVTDLASRDTSSHRHFKAGFNLTAQNLDYFYAHYAQGHDRTDPRLSPARASDLSGLPSATVLTAEFDPLRDEGESYAAAMARAGVRVTSVRFNGQIHPFVYLAGIMPVAEDARRFIASQLRQALVAGGIH